MARKFKYRVYAIEEIIKDGQPTGQGGDDHHLSVFATETSALKWAKAVSFKKNLLGMDKPVLNIWVRCDHEDEDDDRVENWFIKDGIIESHDCG